MRRTKIVATIGPASRDESVLEQLIRSGLDVARLNFSFGDEAWHRETLARLRRAADRAGKPVAVLQDLPGPKIRTGDLAGDPVLLSAGEAVTVAADGSPSGPGRIGTDYRAMPAEVKPGDRVLIADGEIELKVEALAAPLVHCRVARGGLLEARKGMNFPGVKLGLPALTDADRVALDWGVANEVDFVALSFVRTAGEVREVKEILAARNSPAQVIAKIEKEEALDHLPAILEVADALMVARGDLGIELDVARVPVLQKEIIRRANEREVPVITATQMLESMKHSPRPTRAEASDVANAILDGTDAVMLSAETATGRYPVPAVTVMDRIARETESAGAAAPARAPLLPLDASVPEVITRGADLIARGLDIKVIVAATISGSTARFMSHCRAPIPIIGLTDRETTLRRLALYRGVLPVKVDRFQSHQDLLAGASRAAREHGLAAAGDLLLLISGAPLGESGVTNNLRLHRI